MGAGGISRRIIEFTNVLVGRVRGGLAQVNILASMFFGGISGSAIADVSSIGALLIPMMKDSGYDTDYAVDVTITSACQGLIIPPSHNMIIFAVSAGGVSVGQLFLGGMLPGVLLGMALMIISYVIAVKRGYPKGAKISLRKQSKLPAVQILGIAHCSDYYRRCNRWDIYSNRVCCGGLPVCVYCNILYLQRDSS